MDAAGLIASSRKSAGITQRELAIRLRTSQSAVAQLERPGSNPTVARVDAALDALGLRLTLSADPRNSEIDTTLLSRNLRMTPAERLTAFETAHREIEELRALMPDAR